MGTMESKTTSKREKKMESNDRYSEKTSAAWALKLKADRIVELAAALRRNTRQTYRLSKLELAELEGALNAAQNAVNSLTTANSIAQAGE